MQGKKLMKDYFIFGKLGVISKLLEVKYSKNYISTNAECLKDLVVSLKRLCWFELLIGRWRHSMARRRQMTLRDRKTQK